MKSLILIFISFFYQFYIHFHAQELYGDRLSPYIDGRGADLYNEANRTMLNPSLLSESELRITEKHALRRKTMLIAEANRRLHFDILEKRQLAKKASRAQSHEDMIADAWNNSPTGRKTAEDGTSCMVMKKTNSESLYTSFTIEKGYSASNTCNIPFLYFGRRIFECLAKKTL